MSDSVGTRGLAFAAQWLAYALPYRRFVGVLTDANARLGADVHLYSFIVMDLHHLLLAGLPAHFESYMPSHAVRSPLDRIQDSRTVGRWQRGAKVMLEADHTNYSFQTEKCIRQKLET